jgi:hypothetical protein
MHGSGSLTDEGDCRNLVLKFQVRRDSCLLHHDNRLWF